jgi:hypothetical protein
MSRRLTQKLLHQPTVWLREHTDDAPPADLELMWGEKEQSS